MTDSKEYSKKEPSFLVSLISGGIAGTTVDVALYPLDTIKTRLQAPQGFLKAGGFSGVYKGLSAAAAGNYCFFNLFDSFFARSFHFSFFVVLFYLSICSVEWRRLFVCLCVRFYIFVACLYAGDKVLLVYWLVCVVG